MVRDNANKRTKLTMKTMVSRSNLKVISALEINTKLVL